MKKYMVRCDIEGATGVVSYEQANTGGSEYAFGRAMFNRDLQALVQGLEQGGASEVVIYDEHCEGRNIDVGALPALASAICGKPPYRAGWPGGLDGTFAGVVLLGFHSRYGTPGGLLHHSYDLDHRELRLNGVSIGEIGMEAAIAGDCGVPVLLVTGDSAGAAEAEALLPGVCTVVVKESLGEQSGRCYSVSLTAEKIRAAAEAVVKKPPAVNPYVASGNVAFEVELNDGLYLDTVRKELKSDMKDERTLLFCGRTATAAWAEYLKKKLHCQHIMKGD